MTFNLIKSWSVLKIWYKSGIIFGVIGLLIAIVGVNCGGETLLCWYLLFASSPAIIVSNFISSLGAHDIAELSIPFLIIMQYFLLGFIIGLIIDKLKNRKK